MSQKTSNRVMPDRFGILDTCAVFECRYTLEEFISMKNKGYNGIIFGYLDANWDGNFSRLDNYAHTSVFPDMISRDYIENNRAELFRRLELTKKAGLKVWMSVRGPLTRTDLAASNPEAAEKYGAYFGPGGDKWGGSGMNPMCLSFAETRLRYRELMTDAVRSFPEIDGFSFFGGDSYSLVCNEECPRCSSIPCWKNWSDWVAELKHAADAVRPGVEFSIMNWPWWDDMFDMVEDMEPAIGVLAVTNWGFSYGGDGEKYPAAITPWQCQDVQEDTMRVPTDRKHRTVCALTQPWINAPVSDKLKKLAIRCREQGRPFYAWCDLTTSEAVWPYFTPYPATTLDRLRSFGALGAAGVVDFWGISAKTLRNEHTDANTALFKIFFDEPDAQGDAPLERCALELYGYGTEKAAAAAWREIDDALSRWAITGYAQRMHWTLRNLSSELVRSFYVLDLTQPYTADQGAPDSFWPEHLRRPEVWIKLKESLSEVVNRYDRALGYYDRICQDSTETGRINAEFHRDCVLLTRCYFYIGYESCIYHIAGLTGDPLSRNFIHSAAITRRLCAKLYTSLKTVPYNNDMSIPISNMSLF